ncbi:PIH1D1/2/3 CS-like domain-containing protein [Plasmodiophora brassicae]|nr:hypothetical protein PBRA_004099 [Plasmodiophora brassicae]
MGGRPDKDSMCTSYNDLVALRQLLGDDDDVEGERIVEKDGPAEFRADVKTANDLRRESQQIWDGDEVSADPLASEDYNDDREEPRYSVNFMQTLSAEDTYMGLSDKNPSSHSCDALTVTIEMPDEHLATVDLDVGFNRILLRSRKYKLFLHLPCKVDDQNGKATWTNSTLKVVLPIIRELVV